MPQRLDFFLFIGSLYTYVAVMRVAEAAAKADVEVRWRPFNLRAIMVEQNNIPARNAIKMAYTWRDIERRAQRHKLPFVANPPYPVDPELLANRVATVAAAEGWCPAFCAAVYVQWLANHKAPHDRDHLATVLRGLGRDPAAVLARADSAEIKQVLDEETAAARDLGIFGAPTFAIGREIFWGGDRLDEALEWARR